MSSAPASSDQSDFDGGVEAKLVKKLEPLVRPGKTEEVLHLLTVAKYHSGPLPSPEVLAGYEQAHPGLAERIVVMAENSQAHRHKQESRMVVAEYGMRLTGQFAAILSIVLMVGLVGFCAYIKQPVTAAVLGSIATAAGYFLHKQQTSPTPEPRPPAKRKRK